MSVFDSIYQPANYFGNKAYTFTPSKDTTDWFAKFGLTQPKQSGTSTLPEIPNTTTGATEGPVDYSKWIKDLGKEQTKQQLLQSALGLGTGFIGGALTMPFVKGLRQQDYELGLQAMKEKEMSPSAIAQRGALLQQQGSSELSSKADYLRALAQARLSAGQALRWS